MAQNRKFQTVRCIEDCLQQYITKRCWLIESGLGNTASISFPPPLLSFFLARRMEHNGLGCLAFLMSAEIQSLLLHILQQLPILHLSFRDILSLFSLLQFTIHTSPSVFLWYFGVRREDTHLLPSPFTGGKQTSRFHVCVCVCVFVWDFYFACHSPLHLNKNQKDAFPFCSWKTNHFIQELI